MLFDATLHFLSSVEYFEIKFNVALLHHSPKFIFPRFKKDINTRF